MKTESLKTQAYHILKKKITTCQYLPGCQLNEERLQKDLGMSRTPIRDAVSRLEQEGLVMIRPKKGITVAPLTIKQLNMVYEVRELLETYALRTYGNLLPEQELLTHYNFFLNAQHSAEEQQYQEDDAFHLLLMSVVPNEYIQQSYRQIVDQNTRFRVMTGHRTAQRLEETNQEHLQILTACLKKDWEQAAQAMQMHLKIAKAAAFDCMMAQSQNKIEQA